MKIVINTTISVFSLFLMLFSPANAQMEYTDEFKPLHQVSAKECRLCHMDIYEQWAGSMHANSTAFDDPIHGLFYNNVVGDHTKEGVKMKNGKYPVCLKCHAPNAAIDKKTKLDTMAAYKEGVNCVACHSIKRFKGTRLPGGKLRLGIDAYDMTDKIQGPSGFLAYTNPQLLINDVANADKENPHNSVAPFIKYEDGDIGEIASFPVESNPLLFRSSALCLGCHDKRNNGKGVPLCSTGDEYMAGNTRVSCQSCHMPISNGFANHSMGGGHDISVLRRSIALDLDLSKEQGMVNAAITLHNQQPHNVPTGAPFRNIQVKIMAFNKDDKVLWQNYKKHPMKEDPQAYLHNRLETKDGKFSTPPKAEQNGLNTQLKPYEKRILNYSIPGDNVAKVQVKIFYNLLWPQLNKKFKGKLPDDLLKAVEIGYAEKFL